jgi:hypothetical protein
LDSLQLSTNFAGQTSAPNPSPATEFLARPDGRPSVADLFQDAVQFLALNRMRRGILHGVEIGFGVVGGDPKLQMVDRK